MASYEYCYRFCKDDRIIPLYDHHLHSLMRLDDHRRWYLFEIRTYFSLSVRVVDELVVMPMGSEQFGVALVEYVEEGGSVVERGLESFLCCRLEDYGMCDREIRWLARDALNFIEKTAAEPQHADLSVIPVVVELHVWTVQQKNETIFEIFDRDITPECLYPLHLRNVVLPRDQEQSSSIDSESDAESYFESCCFDSNSDFCSCSVSWRRGRV